MTRRSKEEKAARARRAWAMERPELRQASALRAAAAGVTSMAVKAADPDTERLVKKFRQRSRK